MTSAPFWPPKPKLVDSAVLDRRLAGGVGDVVEVALRVGVRQVDRRRVRPGRASVRASAAASIAPAAPIEWPIIDLMRRQLHVRGVLAEDALDRGRLHQVVEPRAGAVGVDVVDVAVVDLGLRQAPRVMARAAAAALGSGLVTA